MLVVQPQFAGSDGYPGPPKHMMDEPFTMQEIRLIREVSGFGFTIRGKEEGSQVRSRKGESVCVCVRER